MDFFKVAVVLLIIMPSSCSGVDCGEYPECGENCVPLNGACRTAGANLAPWALSCGSHRAPSCSACLSGGKGTCSGDCLFHSGSCVLRTHPKAPTWFKEKQQLFRAYEALPCATAPRESKRTAANLQPKSKGLSGLVAKVWRRLRGKRSFDDPGSTRKSKTIAEEAHAFHERTVVNGSDRWSTKAKEVREAFLHAWQGYKDHAWGKDELRPLSKTGRNIFGGLSISMLDSLTTLWLLNVPEEFDAAAAYVEQHLDFDQAEDQMVSVFELTIRALGGLLGAHALSGRPMLLQRAQELAEKMLPAFNTSSGLPLPRWNLVQQEGAGGCEPAVLAEVGSVQLEWRYLSDMTGDLRFREAVDTAFNAIQQTGVQGLLTVHLTPVDHAPTRLIYSKFATGGEIDSYYEYLLKQWLLSPADESFKALFLRALEELPTLVKPKVSTDLKPEEQPAYRLVEVDPTGSTVWKMEHLSCFVPGMIALAIHTLPKEDVMPVQSKWMVLAEGLMATCVEMWTSSASGLAPEHVRLSSKPPHDHSDRKEQDARHSLLRPETAESLYYMYRLTGDEKYRAWGEEIFDAIVEHSKVEAGFASVTDVEELPTKKQDVMPSFLLAETFKYLYLLFAPQEVLSLDRFVFNTEAHPLRRPPIAYAM